MVAAIACIELPEAGWPELLPALLVSMGAAGADGARKATLEALGFVCEQIEPAVLEGRSSDILTAVIGGLRKEEGSVAVRVAAAKALTNSVHFISKHFANAAEAGIIMRAVCEATVASDEGLAVAAFECLNAVVQEYYEHMGPFVGEGVAQMAISVLGSARSDAILLQAIEFWSNLADIEEQYGGGDAEVATDSFYFCQRFKATLLPPLLRLLTAQPSEESTDEWCPSMAAATCLRLLARALGDEVLEGGQVAAFIQTNINGDWHGREAAVMAFGSVLEGPDAVGPQVLALLPKLVELLANDRSVAVQDSAAWAIGAVCAFQLHLVPDDFLPVILQVLCHCLVYPPRVAVNCCWSLMHVFNHLGQQDDAAPSSAVSPLFGQLAAALLQVADRPEADDSSLRSAAYQTLATLLLQAPADQMAAVQAFQATVVGRMETALGYMTTQVVNADDRNRLLDIQSHLCNVLQSTVKKCGEPAAAIADRAMTVALTLLSMGSAASPALEEDVFELIGELASETNGAFVRFMGPLAPVLIAALGKHEESAVCAVAVGVVDDLGRALGPLLLPHCTPIMTQLLAGLNAGTLERAVKPHIVSTIGGVCLAVGGSFAAYLDTTMGILLQAATFQPADAHDYEEVDFGQDLRQSLLEAFTCMVQGLRQDGQSPALAPYLQALLAFLASCAADPERSEIMVRSIAGLLGDIAETYAGKVAGVSLDAPWIQAFLRDPLPDLGRHHPLAPATANLLAWAEKSIASA